VGWDLQPKGRSIVVRMTSNRANRMNPEFFADCHAAFDKLDADHPGRPVVITGEGSAFSAGLDLSDVLPRFERGDRPDVERFFDGFRAMILRVFQAPRRTVAALNGHAYAGGLILALACDVRVVARGSARLALSEVPIGIAIPSTYVEIVRHAVGDPVATQAALEGKAYDVDEAVAAGLARAAVDPAALLPQALALAELIPEDGATVYAATKKALRAPVVSRLAGVCRALDGLAFAAVSAPESVRLQAAALERLRSRGKGS
jgi:enoyl-CoA hydratase